MTIKVGDFAIWNGGYRPTLVEITAITDKTVRLKEGQYRERRGDKAAVLAYGSDRNKLEKVIERMISVESEANRRQAAAGQWKRDEIARLSKEAMA